MAYITKANAARILRKLNLSEIGDIAGAVYKKPIYFLSKSETKYLMLMQSLLKDPEKFAIEVYKPIVNTDTLRLVYESEQPPAYHNSKNCERLNSKFKNFEIPFEIKVRAKEQGGEELERQQVIKFRDWFKKHLEMFQEDPKEFLKRLDIDWNVQRSMKELDLDNSGVAEIENYNLGELENEIDNIIAAAGKYFTSNPDKQNVIRRFQKLTFLAYSTKEIYSNDTNLSDKELKEFLLHYDQTFKKPIKKLLVEYYRVKYNEHMSFQGELLQRLNFRLCSVCADEVETKDDIVASILTDSNPPTDDLPF